MNRFVQRFGDSQNGKRLLEYRSDLVSDISNLPINGDKDLNVFTGSFSFCLEDKNIYMFSEEKNSWEIL